MANTSAIRQQAAHTTYQLSSPSCSTRAIQKSLTLNKKYFSFLEKSQENGPLAEKWQDKKSKRTRQKKAKKGDRNVESNDSREIPDRGSHQTSLASIRGQALREKERKREFNNNNNILYSSQWEIKVWVASK